MARQRVEAVLAPAVDHVAVGTRAAEEEEPAGDTGVVDGDDSVDRGARVEPLPGAAAPNDGWRLAVGSWRFRPSANRQLPTVNSERHLDDRRARSFVQLALLGEGHHQQVAVRHGALDAPLLGLQ